ncbi:GNAT family N-acetyltransferase [Caulobacter sp. RHG1]|uniref:GNAT family N-acetyltransferase n=1 Tax=Caulobacter sp. (strain RHG1) TaxID=2545762 RepID=UPI001557222A|nr:GNAT family N-acetyltransferase [Caulobacter sp. RHG1]NQE61948.1 Acetyltransferase, GNAT family [Caulobacter sp. RHG1]
MAIAPGPTLETARLILRPPIQPDLDGWAELMADPVAARFIGGQQPRSIAWRMMATIAGSWALKGFGMFSVLDKASGRWLGRIGPWVPEGWPGTEVAWGLLPNAQGKGYAAEAATATIDWAFDHLGWTEVIHCIDPENTPSEKAAARLGATNRGPGKLPAPYEETRINIWGQTAAEWRNRPRP